MPPGEKRRALCPPDVGVVADRRGAGYGEAGGGKGPRGGCAKPEAGDWSWSLHSGFEVDTERAGFLCPPVVMEPKLGLFIVVDSGPDGGETLSDIGFESVVRAISYFRLLQVCVCYQFVKAVKVLSLVVC